VVDGGVVWRGTTYPLEEIRAYREDRRQQLERVRDEVQLTDDGC